MGFDISALEGDQPVAIDILDPRNDKPTGIKLRVLGQDSDAYRKALHAQRNRRVQKLARARGAPVTSEEAEEGSVELLAACVVGWEGMVEKGKELAFTAENVRRVLAQYPWVREQVDKAVGDRALFFKS